MSANFRQTPDARKAIAQQHIIDAAQPTSGVSTDQIPHTDQSERKRRRRQAVQEFLASPYSGPGIAGEFGIAARTAYELHINRSSRHRRQPGTEDEYWQAVVGGKGVWERLFDSTTPLENRRWYNGASYRTVSVESLPADVVMWEDASSSDED